MRRMTIFFALVAFLAGGCAAAGRTTEIVAEFPPTRQVESLTLPFDAYSPSLAALYTISNAQDRLTGECMTAAGLEWKVIARPMTVKDLRNRRRYGVIETAIAEGYGYHVPTGLLTPSSVEKLYDAREASLSQSQKDAAYSRTGCAARAARRFQQPTDTATGRLTEWDRASLLGSQRESGVAEALASWRGCMQQRGYSYPDPLAAASDDRWWADASAGPSPAEQAVAVADVACKDRSHLVDAWRGAESRIQREAIRRHGAYFGKLASDLEHDLAQASAVLAGKPA